VQATFDGIAIDSRPLNVLNLSVFGGRAVNLFEIKNDEGTDLLGGAGIDIIPFANMSVSVDFLAVSDKRSYFDQQDTHDRFLAYTLRQRFGQNVQSLVKYRTLNGESRDVNIRFLGSVPASATQLGVSYQRQFETQKEQSTVLSPYTDVLGPSAPYQSVDLRFRRAFGTRFALDLGYFHRDLLRSADSSSYNREFSRTTAGIEIGDILVRDLSCTITGDLWDSEQQQFSSVGADISYSFGRARSRGRVSIGTYYSLYKYDTELLNNSEDRQQVRTYYVSTKVPLPFQTTLRLSYEYEQDPGEETFTTMKAGLRYDF
jgi:hypothetical protein